MMNVKPCPTLPLPAPPVNVLLPLPLTPSPTKGTSFAATQPSVVSLRRRSSTFSAITRWALAVQPGSPPPNSPRHSPCGSPSFEARQTPVYRRPSLSAARGFTCRRTSNSIAHRRAHPGSASFLHIIDTPTTAGYKSNPTPSSAKEFNFDLTNLGYNSVFVHLPYTPSTPSPYLARVANDVSAHIPVSPVPQSLNVAPKKGLKRFRSLGLLKPSRSRGKSVSAAIGTVAATATAVAATSSTRPRSRSRSGSISPSSPVHRVAMSSKAKTHRSKSKSISSPTSANMKKSKRFAPPLPPTLASELLLMQFADGGSLESHAKRMMEKQARAIAPAGSSQASKKQPIAGAAEPLPLGTVFRDETGNVWWDEDEALEYKALLTPVAPDSSSGDWVTFNPTAKSTVPPAIAACVGDEDEERRGSVTSVSSTLSVSLNHLVTPAPADGSAYAMHLLRSSFSYASATPMSPLSIPNTVNVGLASASGAAARNKRTRRRPVPLKLHSSPVVPTTRVNAFEDSFVPSPVAVAVASVTPTRCRHRASTGRVSAPPNCTEFISAARARKGAVDQDGDVVMKENEYQDECTRERGIKKKSSKINLRGRAKALFGVA